MTASQPLSSEARVATAASRRYLGQLCKHFQHRLPVSFDERHGRIEFVAGICELDAAPDVGILTMRVFASDEGALARLEDVVSRHFERFAYRDEIKVRWARTASAPRAT